MLFSSLVVLAQQSQKTNNCGWYSLFSSFQYDKMTSTNISYQLRLSKLVMIISSSTCMPYDTDTFPFYFCHPILFSFKPICFSISFPSFSTYSFVLFLFFTLHFWISFHITYFTLSPLYLYISCTNVLQNTSYTSPTATVSSLRHEVLEVLAQSQSFITLHLLFYHCMVQQLCLVDFHQTRPLFCGALLWTFHSQPHKLIATPYKLVHAPLTSFSIVRNLH